MTDPDIQRTIERLRTHSQRLTEQLRELTADGSDDDGFVTATCAAGGRLVDIRFEPRSRRLETHELRDAVLAAAGRAATAAQEQLTSTLNQFSAEVGMPSGDLGREIQQKMSDVQRVIAEEQDKLRALLDS